MHPKRYQFKHQHLNDSASRYLKIRAPQIIIQGTKGRTFIYKPKTFCRDSRQEDLSN